MSYGLLLVSGRGRCPLIERLSSRSRSPASTPISSPSYQIIHITQKRTSFLWPHQNHVRREREHFRRQPLDSLTSQVHFFPCDFSKISSLSIWRKFFPSRICHFVIVYKHWIYRLRKSAFEGLFRNIPYTLEDFVLVFLACDIFKRKCLLWQAKKSYAYQRVGGGEGKEKSMFFWEFRLPLNSLRFSPSIKSIISFYCSTTGKSKIIKNTFTIRNGLLRSRKNVSWVLENRNL